MMNGRIKSVRIITALLLLAFLTALTGCGSAQTAKVMPPMQKKSGSKTSPYKIAIAESMTIDKLIHVSATVLYKNNFHLSFKLNGGHLKAVHTALGKKVNAGDLLAELDSDDLENKLAKKRIDLERAKLRYDELLLNLGGASNSMNTDLKQTELDIKSINLDIENLTKKIGETKLYAPISGVISFIAPTSVGEIVETGKTFITVSDPNELIIGTQDLNPPPGDYASPYCDLSGVVVGSKATIIVGPLDETRVPAVVTRVINTDPGVKKLPEGQVPANTPPLFQVQAKPEGKLPEKISANSTVTLEINSGKIENAIVIPKKAVEGFGTDTIVRVIVNGKVLKRVVETGYENEEAKIVVISSGIRPGESVIVE